MRERIRNLPAKVKKRMQTALLLLCAVATFAVPAFGGGYSVLKEPPITSSAAAIEDVGLLMVAASAYGEAKKSMNSTDNELKDIFVEHTADLIGSKWQNLGLFLGARDSLSGSVWDAYQDPNGMSGSEVTTFNNGTIADAYNKYKAFGYAVQNMNNEAQKSSTTTVSAEEGLDAMSSAAIKLGSFGVEFLNEYNPGPVLLALYDSHYLGQYASNKLVKIVRNNEVLYNIVCFFGDPVVTVGGWTMSMFVMLNAVLAVAGMALWMLFKVLMGNGTIGDGLVKFLTRILIGTVGIFVIANFMSWALNWVTDTIYEVDESDDTRYVEDNLNIYDWYMTGFQLPSGVSLQIDSLGNFVFNPDTVYAINHYTYNRLIGGATDSAIRARMETLSQYGNTGTASFVVPSSEDADGGSGWDTDVYYAILKNYAENKEDLMDGNDDESSPLYGMTSFNIYKSKFLWMSSLRMDGAPNSGWTVTGNGSDRYYGLNPISAFNLIRSDFSGETITSSTVVYPPIAYVGFDINDSFVTDAPQHMNSLVRFIACFTLTLAAFKGLITIFTAGFGGLISGGVKTATGSAHGLGQAIGAVIALLGGIIGISLIMSMTLALLDTVYGIAVELVGDTEVLDGFLGPIVDTVGEIPVIGPPLKSIFRSIVGAIISLILALTFPKLGGIPITVFAQAMADLPGRIAERAQMLEAQLLSGRGAASGGLPPRGGSGQYGRMASDMMGNAFSSGTKQAGRIIGAGAAAAGSLAGAGLATLGRSLNNRADRLEGAGVSNPGGFSDSMWDNMSDDMKNDAADFAASQENWDNMSESERRAAMEQAGFYESSSSSDSSTQHDTSSNTENTQYSNEEGSSAEQYAGETEGSLDDPNAAAVPEVGEGQSISAQTPTTESSMESIGSAETAAETGVGTPADVSQDAALGGTDGADGNNADNGTNGADGSSLDGKNGTSGDSGNHVEQNLNNTQESIAQEVKEDSEVNMDQDVNAENKMVDASLSSEQGDLNTIEGAHTETAPGAQDIPSGTQGLNGAAAAGTAAAATVSANGGKQATGGALPNTSNAGQRNSSAGQQSGASATYQSVSQSTQVGGNAVQQTNVSASQNARANNMQVNQNSSHSSVSEAGSSQTTTNVSGGSSVSQSLTQNNSQAVRDADQGASKQSMNGMSRGKYGKQMTVEEQKKARFQHAAGDALQMMGGNRTIGEGIGDALSYAKEAALVASVPEELQTSEFMNGLRMRRMERMQRQQMRQRDKK